MRPPKRWMGYKKAELMTPEQIDAALKEYNFWAAEWTRRELDRNGELPHPDDDWMNVSTVGTFQPNELIFHVNSDSEKRMYHLKLKRGTPIYGEGWSLTRPQIPRNKVVRGWMHHPEQRKAAV